MQKTILTLAILSLGLGLAEAQSTVNFSAGVGQPNLYWAGAPVPDQNEVRIGFFTSGFDFSAHLYDLNALDSAWKGYGSTLTTNIMGMQPGGFAGAATQPAGSGGASLFEGQKVYLWIFKTVSDSVPTADFSNVQGYGLFSSTSNTWYFPASGEIITGTGSINSSEIDQAWFGNYDLSHLYLDAVPEPSIAGLAVLSLGMLLLAVRRKQ